MVPRRVSRDSEGILSEAPPKKRYEFLVAVDFDPRHYRKGEVITLEFWPLPSITSALAKGLIKEVEHVEDHSP